VKTRRLGKSDINTSVVILGAWSYGGWFWGRADDAVGIEAIHRALDLGMTAIDTAPVYGVGHSEEVVGRALAGRRNEAVIMTKCGLRWDDDTGDFDFDLEMPGGEKHTIYRNLRPASVRTECEASLRRLGTDTIDLYQCHWPDPSTPIAETMGEMVRLHAEGKIRAVGVSNFSPREIEETRDALGDVPLASNQPKYSLLYRNIEEDVVPYAIENDVGLIAYSPLEMGLLTGKVSQDREFGEGDLRSTLKKFTPGNRRRVNEALRTHMMPIAEKHGATLAQIASAWVFTRPGMTASIVGARTAAQVDENAGAARVELDAGDMATLTDVFGALELEK
jgi:aryl-alcohol dehydrogenase-like predicted oxidoreductase